MRDALEQGRTGTYPPTGVPCDAVLSSYATSARMRHSPPVQAAWVEEVIEWLRQPVIDYVVSVELEPVEEHLAELSPYRVVVWRYSSCGSSSRSRAASINVAPASSRGPWSASSRDVDDVLALNADTEVMRYLDHGRPMTAARVLAEGYGPQFPRRRRRGCLARDIDAASSEEDSHR
jgi:hypothetical protein